MQWLNGVMPRLVSCLAIRSWRDLVWKSLICFAVFHLVALPLSFVVMGPEARPAPFSVVWFVTLVSVPVLVVQFVVVTYLDRLHRRLVHLSRMDALTGLPLRRTFLDDAAALRDVRPKGGVVILDADHFKRINEEHGEDAGDACLQAIAARLRACAGGDAVLGRLAGEEFAVFLPDADDARLRAFEQQMTLPMRATVGRLEGAVKVHVSLGAAFAQAGVTLATVLRRADIALSDAKVQGRARMVVWDDTVHAFEKTS